MSEERKGQIPEHPNPPEDTIESFYSELKEELLQQQRDVELALQSTTTLFEKENGLQELVTGWMKDLPDNLEMLAEIAEFDPSVLPRKNLEEFVLESFGSARRDIGIYFSDNPSEWIAAVKHAGDALGTDLLDSSSWNDHIVEKRAPSPDEVTPDRTSADVKNITVLKTNQPNIQAWVLDVQPEGKDPYILYEFSWVQGTEDNAA